MEPEIRAVVDWLVLVPGRTEDRQDEQVVVAVDQLQDDTILPAVEVLREHQRVRTRDLAEHCLALCIRGLPGRIVDLDSYASLRSIVVRRSDGPDEHLVPSVSSVAVRTVVRAGAAVVVPVVVPATASRQPDHQAEEDAFDVAA